MAATPGTDVQAAAASAVAGEEAEQACEQADGEPARKRARGRPLGSKTKVHRMPLLIMITICTLSVLRPFAHRLDAAYVF